MTVDPNQPGATQRTESDDDSAGETGRQSGLVEQLARELAEGHSVDWDQQIEEAPDDDRLPVLRGLQRLADLQQRFQATADDELGDSPPLRATELERWGHLEVGELLGSGTFGDVFRAYDPVLRRDVALKLRGRESVASAESTFLAEARRLARVRHPHVLAVHGADVHFGRAGLWADLLDGETLEQHLRDGREFGRQDVLEIAIALADALAAVHAAGIVHGDVKGSNVMLEEDGRAMLMDFGAASESDGSRSTGSLIGSPLSMPPESFSGTSPGLPGDVYSLGVLLFRMITGRYPVEAKTLEELEAKHAAGPADPWQATDRPPKALRDLVEAALERNPHRRPRADELAAELRRVEELPRRRFRQFAVAAVILSLTTALTASLVGWRSATRSAQEAERARFEAESTTEFLTDLLLAPDIIERGPGVKVVEVMDEARELAETDLMERPLLQSRIFQLIGQVKASLGQLDDALEIFEQSESALTKLPAPTVSGELLEVELRRARLYVDRAELEEASQLLAEVEPKTLALDPASDERALWLRTRSVVSAHRGEFVAAERDLRELIAVRPERADDDQLLEARSELAVVLERLGRIDEAEPLYRANLEANLERYGERHAATLSVRQNLAGLLAQMGRFAQAEQLFRHNIEIAEEFVGKEHPLYTVGLTSLANVISDQGNNEEAVELDRVAMPLAVKVWGNDHPRTNIARMNAANRTMMLGNHDEAEPLLEDAIRGLEARRGENAPPSLYARMLLAQLYLETSRPAAAERLAQVSLERSLAGLGPESPITLGTETRLGTALTRLDRTSESLPLLRASHEKHLRVLGSESFEIFYADGALAAAEHAAGNVQRARELLCDSLDRAKRTLGDEHPNTVSAREQLEGVGGCPR